MARYSVIIQPNDLCIAQVQQMKEALAAEIGWYNSKNSLAHLTVNEFEKDEKELHKIKQTLTEIARFLKTEVVTFNHFDTFPNGAFFLAPNEISKHYLKTIMTAIHQEFPYPVNIKSNEPHLSIGRRISPENMIKTKELFQERPTISFLCNKIALRVFNEERKQFDILETFPFLDEKKSRLIQGSLF